MEAKIGMYRDNRFWVIWVWLNPENIWRVLQPKKRDNRTMKKIGFGEEKILSILRKAEGGGTVKAVCARRNVSGNTFHKWRAKYGGGDVNETRCFPASSRRVVRANAAEVNASDTVNRLMSWMGLVGPEVSKPWHSTGCDRIKPPPWNG